MIPAHLDEISRERRDERGGRMARAGRLIGHGLRALRWSPLLLPFRL